MRDGTFLIPKGTYKNRGYSVEAPSAPYRKIGGTTTLTNIEFWTGRQVQLDADVFIRSFTGLDMTPAYNYSSVNLEQGNFKLTKLELIKP